VGLGASHSKTFRIIVPQQSQVDASDPDNTHASVPAPLIVSLSDDYVHIQVKPPEAPLLESDFQHPQHKNQVSHDIDAPPAAVAEQKDASLAFAFEQPSVNGVGCPTKSVKVHSFPCPQQLLLITAALIIAFLISNRMLRSLSHPCHRM